MRKIRFTSKQALLIIGLFLCVYRISIVNEREISWDVLGYYIPLPATFIYDEPMLDNTEWLKKINDEKKLTGTLFMVSSTPDGEPMYLFLFGTAILYLPFFLIGHFSAFLFGMPMDGFSLPYQYALVIGATTYTIIAFHFLRKILRIYFSESIAAIVLLITFFSTNAVHHLSFKNLETVNFLFMFVCLLVWFTIKWHENQKLKYLIPIGASITMMALIKPSEVVIVLLPLFWNVTSIETARNKLKLILNYKKQFIFTIVMCFLIASPQILYWIIKTGSPFYDTYKNPGVGLDLFPPHSIDALISYRKGWLLYTPVMLFYLWGLYVLYLKNKKLFYPISIYFSITFLIITSWSEWWYGAGFSNRPLIATYPLLAIGFGYFLSNVAQRDLLPKLTLGITIVLFTALNQFQWWQLKNYILDPYRTTKEYYWSTFLKTSVSQEDKEKLLVERDFSGALIFNDLAKYKLKESHIIQLGETNVFNDTALESNPYYLKVENDESYILTQKKSFRELTKKDHVWVRIRFDIRFPEKFEGLWPCFVYSMERSNGDYGYYASDIVKNDSQKEWQSFQIDYMTPEIRNTSDQLKTYFWKRGEQGFDLKNVRMEVFERIK